MRNDLREGDYVTQRSFVNGSTCCLWGHYPNKETQQPSMA